MDDVWRISTDGGSRGNPGPAGAGVVIAAPNGTIAASGGAFLGHTTNNVAEYEALLWGMRAALALGARKAVLRADSELVVKQLRGEYRVKNEGLKPLFLQAQALRRRFDVIEFEHVRRAQNAAADALANEAMDVGSTVGDAPQPPRSAEVQLTGSFNDDRGRHMYDLMIRAHFDAAHALVGYPGECCRLHGHTWDVEVVVRGSQLDEVGIVYDFKQLKLDLAAVIEPLDHAYLNDVPPFDKMNATAENLSRFLFEQLSARVGEAVRVVEVSVWESPIARITYRPGE